jgi:hypothetical protein
MGLLAKYEYSFIVFTITTLQGEVEGREQRRNWITGPMIGILVEFLMHCKILRENGAQISPVSSREAETSQVSVRRGEEGIRKSVWQPRVAYAEEALQVSIFPDTPAEELVQITMPRRSNSPNNEQMNPRAIFVLPDTAGQINFLESDELR